MAVIALVEGMELLARKVTRTTEELVNSPESPSTSDSMIQTATQIDRFVATFPLAELNQLAPEQRTALTALLSAPVQRLLDSLHTMLSVAEQIEELDSYAPGTASLAGAIERLEAALTQLGISVGPSRKPPIVTRGDASAEDSPSFRVANVTRRPRLEPYIAMALRDAQPRELEPGLWYADLEAFPGVWADGPSPEECLGTLADVLHEWLIIKVAHGERDYPVFEGLDPRMLVLDPRQ